MLKENKLLIGKNGDKELNLLLDKANRHVLLLEHLVQVKLLH